MTQILPSPPILPKVRTLADAERAIRSLHEYTERLRQAVARTEAQPTIPEPPTIPGYLTDGLIHVPPLTGLYPYYNNAGLWAPNEPGFMVVGASYVDPVFGATIKRLTADNQGFESGSEIYSKNCYFNADGTIVHWRGPGPGFPHTLIRTSDGSVVLNPATFSSDSSFDPVDASSWYFFSGANLRKHTLPSGAGVTIKTFAATLGALGGSVDWIDRTGRYMVLHIGTTIRVWDKQADVLYSGTISDAEFMSEGAGGWIGISPDGKYVITSTGATGSTHVHRSYLINHATQSVDTVGVKYWTLSGGHGDLVSCSDGKTYEVTFDSNVGDPNGGAYRVDVTLPQSHATPATRDQQRAQNLKLFPLSVQWDSGHFSGVMKGALIDWCFFDVESGDDTFGASLSSWRAYEQELGMVNVLTGEVRRLAHHRSRSTSIHYAHQPKCSASQDGAIVAWQSNFGYDAPGVGYGDMYAIEI
jgi:hypothetical protein